MRWRDYHHRNIRVLGNFGYADRIQKYSFLLSINDTSSRKLRQIRADSRLALRLLIDKRNLHVCGEKEDLNDDY
jgi:hypothetical protein